MSERQPGNRRGDSPETAAESIGEPAGGSANTETIEQVELEVGGKTVVVSVRFPPELLERIKAYAAIMGKSTNQVIREGVEATIIKIVGSEEFRQQAEDFILRAVGVIESAQGQEVDSTMIKRLGASVTSACGLDRNPVGDRHSDLTGDGSSLADIV